MFRCRTQGIRVSGVSKLNPTPFRLSTPFIQFMQRSSSEPSVREHHRGHATSDPKKNAVLCGGVLLVLLLGWRLALREGSVVAKDGVTRVPGVASAPSMGRPSRVTAESKSTATSRVERAPSFPHGLRNGSNIGSVTTVPAPLEHTPVPEVIFDVRDRSPHEKFPGRRRCRIHPQCNASTCHRDPDLAFRGVVKSVVTVTGACRFPWRSDASASDVRHIVAQFIAAYPPTHPPRRWRKSAHVPGELIHLFDATWTRKTRVLPPPPEVGDTLDFDAERITVRSIYNNLFGQRPMMPAVEYPFPNATRGYYMVGTHPISPPRAARRRCNCVGCVLDEPFHIKVDLFWHTQCKPSADASRRVEATGGDTTTSYY